MPSLVELSNMILQFQVRNFLGKGSRHKVHILSFSTYIAEHIVLDSHNFHFSIHFYASLHLYKYLDYLVANSEFLIAHCANCLAIKKNYRRGKTSSYVSNLHCDFLQEK